MTNATCDAFYFNNGVCSLLKPTYLYKTDGDTSQIDAYMVNTYTGITNVSIDNIKLTC